jgi:uroporphyrin-3 C-methyltransferase
MIQSPSRSRDENILVDIDPALRVAMQQSALTGMPSRWSPRSQPTSAWRATASRARRCGARSRPHRVKALGVPTRLRTIKVDRRCA